MTRKLFALGCFAFFIFTLSSCNKDEETDIPSVGKASFKVNGDMLETEIRVIKRDEKFLIHLEKYRIVGGEPWPWEILSLLHVHHKLDSVQRIYNRDSLNTASTDLVSRVGGFFSSPKYYDVGCEIFEVIESDSINNWVVLDSQSNDFSEVSGRFALHMYKVQGCDADKYADTLRITDGKFHFSL